MMYRVGCEEEYAAPHLACCLDLVDYKLDELCSECNDVLSSFLINKRHSFIVSENEYSSESDLSTFSSYSEKY